MRINVNKFNSKLKSVDELNTDEKIEEILEFIKRNYGDLSSEECAVIFKKVPKILILFSDYLDAHSSLYNDTKKIKDETLRNLVDNYIYLKGMEEAKELGIDVEGDFSSYEQLLNDSIVNKYDSVGLYLNSLNFPVLSREEKQELAKKMKAGDMNARKRLIECNLKLVVFIAARVVRNKGEVIPFSDMIDEGNTGLIHAIDKYDFAKGTKISTYVTSWIVNKISYAIDKQSKDIQKPVHFNDAYKKYKQVLVLMSYILGRDATKQEIASILNITLEQLDEFENLKGTFISLNTPVDADDDAELYEIIPDDSMPPIYENYDNEYLSEELKRIISSLSDREANIIYGLFYENKNLEEIGKENNITRERVRQIANKVLVKLGARKDVRNLAPYVTGRDINSLDKGTSIQLERFGIREYNKKVSAKRKTSEVKFSPLYEKMKLVCKQLQNGEYTYDDLVVDNNNKTLKKTNY